MSMVSLSAIGALIMVSSLVLFFVSIQKPVNVSIDYNVATVESQVSPKTETASVKKDVIDEDTYLLAQIINAEAKGESYLGKLAVGNVVLNRINDSEFPDTTEEVVFQRGQFSPVMDGSIYNKPSKESLNAAKELRDGRRVLAEDVLFFYNPYTSTSSWIFTRPTVGQIGNHMFAR
jgi:N-acetylmuramoyl-L-alanine amidase